MNDNNKKDIYIVASFDNSEDTINSRTIIEEEDLIKILPLIKEIRLRGYAENYSLIDKDETYQYYKEKGITEETLELFNNFLPNSYNKKERIDVILSINVIEDNKITYLM